MSDIRDGFIRVKRGENYVFNIPSADGKKNYKVHVTRNKKEKKMEVVLEENNKKTPLPIKSVVKLIHYLHELK